MALRGGRPASAFHPLPFPGAGRPRKVLAGLVSEGWGPGHCGGPRSRVRGASSSSTESSPGPGPLAEAGRAADSSGRGWPRGAPWLPAPGLSQAPRGSVDIGRWAGGREGPVPMWQEGEEGERVDKKRRQVWWPPPQSSSYKSHGSQGWLEANAQGHKYRQTDAHTEATWGTESASAVGQEPAATRPSTLGGLPARPRSPRPGQTMSRGECVGPAE